MDSNFSKIFIEIVSCSNITKAAENLGYTQSGLSHTLNRAEDELGFKLFYRAKRGVTLTPEGRILLPAAKELERSVEKLYETISSIQGITKGLVTIGTFQSISINMLSSVLKAFQQDFPQIKIDLKEGSIEEIHDWIMAHTADLGITSIQENDEFDYIPIHKDPMVAVVPYGYNLKNKNYIDVSEFENQPFIMASMDKQNDNDVDKVLKKAGIDVNVTFSSKDDVAIMSMVENGLGVSILPELITLRHFQKVHVLPLNPPFYRTLGIGLYSLENVSPAAAKFIEYAVKILSKK